MKSIKANNIVTISEKITVKMRLYSEGEVAKHIGHYPEYGHNKVTNTLCGVMGEFAVRQLYRVGGCEARQTLKGHEPDLIVPDVCGNGGQRLEEVKSWQSGYSWDRFGKTIRITHADDYHAKGRDRVWFCEVDIMNRTVIVHGWVSTADIVSSIIITTDGPYGGENHLVEVLNKVDEVMAWIEPVYDTGWW